MNDGKGSTYRGRNRSPERVFDAWSTEKKTAHKRSGGCRTRHNNVLRHPSPVSRLPSATSTAWGHGSDKKSLLKSSRGGGDATNDCSSSANAGGGGFGGGDCLPRTHIIGMNGGRLPREVRQVPIDRPLTAPCGKVGRQRVRARSVGGPVNS